MQISNERYQLFHGDCLEEMVKIPDDSVDLVLCDLPYGVTRNKWDKKIPLDKLWDHYHRVVRSGGVVALFAHGKFLAEVMVSNFEECRYNIVWVKSQGTDFLNCNKKPIYSHEVICIFYDKQPVYNPQMRTGFKSYRVDKRHSTSRLSSNIGNFNPCTISESKDGSRFPIDVITFPIERNRKHSTAKPVGLLEWFIKTYTNEGMTVLDNCMGSGATGVACVNTNRKFIGIEKNEDFYHKAVDRISRAEVDNQHK